jgi:uncharacterized membrane protein YvlD (DUF360 family)
MTFLRSLFLNFLVVFFVDRVIPGIRVVSYEGVPDVINDVIFAGVVAFLNASIYPAFYIFGAKATTLTMGIVAAIVSFGSFFMLLFVQIGVTADSFSGAFFAGLIVFAMSLFTNVLEKKHMHFKD